LVGAPVVEEEPLRCFGVRFSCIESPVLSPLFIKLKELIEDFRYEGGWTAEMTKRYFANLFLYTIKVNLF